MNKFNLTFWGEILPGHDPATVKARFAKMFDIRDAERLEHFFSGETITLRRNIERKVAAEYFAKLHKLGVEAELIKVDATGNTPASRRAQLQPEPEPEGGDKRSQWEHARRQAELEVIQRAQLEAEARKREENERRRQEQQRAEEERLFRERQAELERERQEALARREAEKQRERLEREAEAARLRSEQEERRRQQAEEEERQRLQREEERQRKAEEAARKKAEAAAEAELRRAEEVATRQEELERQQRLREEEARRKEAEETERLRLRAEREEQLRKEREERRRLKAEAAERRKAEARAAAEERRREQERRRREREEALAKKRAEREAARKAAEAEAARRREEQAELERQRVEQAAREQAQREAERREKAAAAAQRKAALAAAREAAERELARKKAEAEERKRLRQEAARREAAVRAQEKQQAAEHQAREREQVEKQRREQEHARKQQLATEKAQREAEAARERERVLARQREEESRRKAEREAQALKRQAEREARARERAAEKAQQEALKQAELEREQARAQERKRMEEQAIARGAAGLAKQQNLKRSPTRVKSGLELPRREKPGQGPVRKRQPGAPNDYQTRPFRNTSEIRNRPALAAQKLRRGLGLAALALAVTLLLVGRYMATPPVTVYSGPGGIAATAGGQLLIHIGDKLLLHDRAGIGKSTVEVSQLQLQATTGPLAFTGDGQLLLRATTLEDSTPRLQRCDLAALSCEPLADIALAADSALAVHTLTGQLFLADPDAGTVSKYDPDGRSASTAQLPLARRPALTLDSGLLFINSHEGPAVSVRRYEDQAFGQQLDEVLLLPPAALDAGQVQVFDFLSAGDRWWVSMINPDTGSAGLYLFDSQWKYLSQVALPDTHVPARLVPWGQKVLVTLPSTSRILRFDGSGSPEADLESDLLSELIRSQERHRAWVAIGWTAAFSLCLVVVAVTLSFTYIQYLRNLVYRGRSTRGAEPLDQFSDDLQWAEPAQARDARLRRTAITYGLLCLATVLLLAGLGTDIHLLLAALVALAGPAAGLYLYSRGGTGHAGAAGETLALVDHRDVYHLATGARIQYRGPFLLIDDVVVFTGTSLLPALAPAQVKEVLQPVAAAGARVDRKTVMVKLLEVRHPLALAAMVCALCALAAAVALLSGAF